MLIAEKVEKQVAKASDFIAKETKSQHMRNWLSPQDPSSNHNNAVSQCHKGTGEWFIQSETFKNFKCGRIPFLWLNGMSGCGKTILCSSVIEDLKHNSSSLSLRVLYFYFDFTDTRKQTLDGALRSLLWQASTYSGSSSRVLEKLYSSCEEGRAQPSTQSLIQDLKEGLLLQNTVTVIDALDESTTRSDLLSWLSSLARHDTGNIRIIVTSRKEQDIEGQLAQWLSNDAIISLQEQIVDTDIGAYVRHRLHLDPQLQRWRNREAVQDEIEARLMDGAHGMYVGSQLGIVNSFPC